MVAIICLGETPQSVEVKTPIHISCLPTACSATSPNFHLPLCYEGPPLEVNISLDMVKPEHDKYIICKFPHMAGLREALK